MGVLSYKIWNYPAVSGHHVKHRFLRIVPQRVRHVQHGLQVLFETRPVGKPKTRGPFGYWFTRAVSQTTPRSVKVPLVQAANLLPVQG